MENVKYHLSIYDGCLITPKQYDVSMKGKIKCPDCGGRMMKSSNRDTHYFKHIGDWDKTNQHHIGSSMTQWHLDWQKKYDKTEIRVSTDNSYVILDIFLEDSKTVIEVQHSPLSEKHIEKTIELEKQGYKVIWIFDILSNNFAEHKMSAFLRNTNAMIIFDYHTHLERVVAYDKSFNLFKREFNFNNNYYESFALIKKPKNYKLNNKLQKVFLSDKYFSQKKKVKEDKPKIIPKKEYKPKIKLLKKDEKIKQQKEKEIKELLKNKTEHILYFQPHNDVFDLAIHVMEKKKVFRWENLQYDDDTIETKINHCFN